MKIEFDPDKNTANIRDRDLPFELVVHLEWKKALIWEDTRKKYEERRWSALIPYGGMMYAVIFTLRQDKTRIISFRRANQKERMRHEKETRS